MNFICTRVFFTPVLLSALLVAVLTLVPGRTQAAGTWVPLTNTGAGQH